MWLETSLRQDPRGRWTCSGGKENQEKFREDGKRYGHLSVIGHRRSVKKGSSVTTK